VERTVYSAQGVLAGLFPAAAADETLDAQIHLNGAHHDEFMVSWGFLLKPSWGIFKWYDTD
jgi:hypothetical protein